MSDLLSQLVKAQRIDFIVKYMINSQLEGDRRFLLDEWLGELTEDLLVDLSNSQKRNSVIDEPLPVSRFD